MGGNTSRLVRAGAITVVFASLLSSASECAMLCCLASEGGDAERHAKGVFNRDSSSGRTRHFTVSGTNAVQNMDLLRWAEELAAVVAQTVERKLPYSESRPLHLAVGSVPPSDKGYISLDEGGDALFPAQCFRVWNYDSVGNDEASAALCKLILDGYVADSVAADVAETNVVGSATVRRRPVPRWMYRGFARYIYIDRRAEDADTVLTLWKSGRLKPLPEILDSRPTDRSYPYGAVYGMLIAWLESCPDKANLMAAMFRRLASGGALTSDWFAGQIDGCKSAADVDEKWENWVIAQWRVVHRPGVATPLHVEQLRDRLAIRNDDVGMPLSANIDARVPFRRLTDLKGRDWLDNVLRNKIASLKLLAVGKGQEFNDVVNAYCGFLEAVADGRSSGRCSALLEKAESGLAALEKSVSEKGAAASRK